ncbi:uncharacterized protein TNIN_22212 [Trichonephila inaurata madagascariensis]|uniref:Uncharacterized protein n=1 Tax=Trichonephila inaurata madagascariensis TaxID=2747483 RepID=A0A8X6YS73_9ARAC|nr:uncharacterized protein TNIN_22212 [Trichonephila inaurata madagascariensis]
MCNRSDKKVSEQFLKTLWLQRLPFNMRGTLSVVDSNPYLTDAVKLQYLKSALRGDALRIIQSISIVDSNYKLAFSLLEERYSNHREQVYAHLKRFLSVQPVHNESASAILNLIDVTNECVRSLEVLNQSVEGFSSILFAYILGEKFDPNTKIWWERKLEKENLPTVTDLEFLKDHARTLNASKSVINVKKITNKSFAIFSNSNDKHPQNLCKLCNLSCRRLLKCPKFLKFSVKERVDYVKKQNLCFSCFLKHSVRNCTSSYICRNCLKKHNVLLCYKSETNFSGFSSEKPNAVRDQYESSNQSKTALNDSSTPVTDSNKTDSQVETGVRFGNVLAPEFIPKNSLSFMSNQTGKRKSVLLSTAICYLLDEAGNKITLFLRYLGFFLVRFCLSDLKFSELPLVAPSEREPYERKTKIKYPTTLVGGSEGDQSNRDPTKRVAM